MLRRILVDADGVLTDGKLTIDHAGRKLFKTFSTRDIRAIRELVAHGYEVYIVTADSWPGIEAYAEKVGAQVRYERDKVPDDEPYVGVGDDAWDVRMLEGAAEAFCPRDADESVRAIDGIHILPVRGGEGVMAEVVRRLL